MDPKVYVIIGGFFHLFWAIFHIFFPKFFNWESALKNAGHYNRSLMHIQSIFLLITFLIFSGAAFLFTNELVETRLGNYLIASFGLFWFLRSIANLYFFGIKDKKADLFLIIFIAGFIIHMVPLVMIYHH